MIDTGTVYLIQLDRPIHHARHYLGYSRLERVEQRLERHKSGNGAKLLKYANEQGIDYIHRRRREQVRDDMGQLFKRFPILDQRRRQLAGTLSGGEQQMLAISRALMARPQLLVLDEPSMGLAPLVVQEIFSIIQELRAEGRTILLIEQNARAALRIGDRGYVMETGKVVLEGEGQFLLEHREVQRAYLGKGHKQIWEA